MTCKQVLAIIDGLPPEEWRPVHREAVERHTNDCRACRDALEGARVLTSALGILPEPALPEGLAVTTMARIMRGDAEPWARMTNQRATATVGADYRSWVWTLVGQVAGLAAVMWLFLASPPDVTAPRIAGRAASVISMPASAPAALLLAAGLLLYLVGLFAPMRRRRISGLSRAR